MRDPLPRPDRRPLLIGVGSELRGDDGVGPALARALRERAAAGDGGAAPADVLAAGGDELLDLLEGRDAVVLVDCMRSGAAPGTIRRFDASAAPLPLRGATSSHALGVAEAIELARALGRLPERVIVYGVEGERFDPGAGLSPAVARALDPLSEAVARELT